MLGDDEKIENELDDLDDLIRYLEKEKDRLKMSVEDAAKEWEFSEAKAYAKAHSRIASRLHVLRNLKDPVFDERARHYRILVSLEEQLKIYVNVPHIMRHFTEEIKETNQALDKLENTKFSPIDTQYVDDAIFQLVDGTIESFKLHLNKDEELVFDFACQGKLLMIGFSYKKGALFRSMKKRLRKIGFSKIKGARRFVYTIDVSKFRDAQMIKQLLAIVIFDVFGRSWIDNPAELEINHKPNFPSDEENAND